MRFFREANTLARLRHRNVLPIHEVGELSGQPYLIVPLALTSFDDLLERSNSSPAPGPRALGGE